MINRRLFLKSSGLALIAGVPDPAARRRWTYKQLLDQSLRTARALQKRFKDLYFFKNTMSAVI